MAGVPVLEITTADGEIPKADDRTKIHKAISDVVSLENLLIFINGDRTRSLWYWAKREGAKAYPRTETYMRYQPADLLLFQLFEKYSWHLDDRPGGKPNEINPDVLGYIFEKYINQKAFGAYYTRPEITEYLCDRTINKLILDRVNATLPPQQDPRKIQQFESIDDLVMHMEIDVCRHLVDGEAAILWNLSLLDPACGSGAFGLPQRSIDAFPELRCTFAGRSIVPDISAFTWERIPRNASGEVENTFTLHPDWVIEILSPEQRPTRVINNILFCLNNGTHLGWLIDPDEKTVILFQPGQQPIAKEASSDRLLMISQLEHWHLILEELFNWLNLP